MKDWILKHKKIYFAVVIGIALALFMAITVRGCNKLEKAYAATVEMYDLSNMVWAKGSYSDLASAGNYIIVLYGDNTQIFLFNDEPLNIPSDGCMFYDYRVDCYMTGEGMKASFSSASDYNIRYINCKPGTATAYGVLGSNYDYTGDGFNGPHSNMTFPWIVQPIKYVYSFSSPFVTIKTVDNMLPSEYHILDTESCYWEWSGTLNNVVAVDDNMLLQVTFEVKVPKREYLLELFNSSGFKKTYQYVNEHGRDNLKEYLDSDNFDVYSFVHYIRYEEFSSCFENGYDFSYRLSFDDVMAYLCEVNPDLLSEYPANTLDDNLIRALFNMHLFVDNTISLVYYDTGSDVYYGNPVINYYHLNTLKAVNVVVKADIFNTTEEELSKILQEAIKEGYDEVILDSEDKVADLEQELEDINQQLDDLYSVGLGFGGELSGTNLWNGFSSLVKGLGGIATTVGGFGAVVGAVFSFLPLQVASMISFTLVALCIIAIIKAIRG